jgi:hypothetical protein
MIMMGIGIPSIQRRIPRPIFSLLYFYFTAYKRVSSAKVPFGARG